MKANKNIRIEVPADDIFELLKETLSIDDIEGVNVKSNFEMVDDGKGDSRDDNRYPVLKSISFSYQE